MLHLKLRLLKINITRRNQTLTISIQANQPGIEAGFPSPDSRSVMAAALRRCSRSTTFTIWTTTINSHWPPLAPSLPSIAHRQWTNSPISRNVLKAGRWQCSRIGGYYIMFSRYHILSALHWQPLAPYERKISN